MQVATPDGESKHLRVTLAFTLGSAKTYLYLRVFLKQRVNVTWLNFSILPKMTTPQPFLTAFRECKIALCKCKV